MNASFGQVNVVMTDNVAGKIWDKIEEMEAKDVSQDEAISTKVDKEEGMRLISSADVAKLATIEEGAEANVQSDWYEESRNSDAYINNKPDGLTCSEISSIVNSLS